MKTSKQLFVIFVQVLCLLPPAGLAYHPFNSEKLDVKVVTGVAETYDDNITSSESNEKSDFITEIRAGIEGEYKTKRQELKFNAASIQELFARESDFNNNAQEAAFDYRLILSPESKLRILDSLDHFEEAQSFEDSLGRTDGRYSRTRNVLGFDYERELNSRLAVKAGYRNTFNFLSRSDLRDSFSNKANLNVRLMLSSATSLEALYEFIHQQFRSSASLPATSGFMNTIGLKLVHFITKKFSVSGESGLHFIENFNNDDIVRPYFTLDLDHDLDERTKLNLLKIEKRYQMSAFQSEVVDTWRVSGGIERELTDRLKGYAQGFYANADHENTFTDNLFGFQLGVRYELTEQASLETSYRYIYLSSSEDTRDYLKNTAQIKLNYTFG